MGKKSDKIRAKFFSELQLQLGAAGIRTVQQSEQLYGNVMGAFGQPGTYPGSPGYEAPAFSGGQFTGGQGILSVGEGKVKEEFDQGIYGQSGAVVPYSILGIGGGHSGLKAHLSRRIGDLVPPGMDVEAQTQAVMQDKQFQILSRLTGEAEQLIAKEGPAWERFQSSIIGPMKEGAGQAMEQTMDDLNNMYAKGGTARNKALQQAMQIQAQIDVNMRHFADVSNARYIMDQFARENATRQIEFNMAWAQNIAGVRQAYVQGINSAIQYMGQVAVPSSANFRSVASAIGAQSKARWVTAALGVASVGVGIATGNPALIAGGLATVGGAATGGSPLGTSPSGGGGDPGAFAGRGTGTGGGYSPPPSATPPFAPPGSYNI